MADYNSPVEKIAIYDLDTIPTSYDSSATFIPVSNEDWGTTPKKMPLQSIGVGNSSTIHKEAAKYQITSTSIDETFDAAFIDVPVNIESIQVYKMVDGYKYNFLLKNLLVTASKITATVEDVDPDYTFSDFTGIILDYCLFERN